jgi:hypothetical protein
MENRPSYEPGAPVRDERELFEIRSKIKVSVWPGHLSNVRGLVDHLSDFKRIYADHWISRGLGEVESMCATPEAMHGGLEEQSRRFDCQLSRLRRLRNSGYSRRPGIRNCLPISGCIRQHSWTSMSKRNY